MREGSTSTSHHEERVACLLTCLQFYPHASLDFRLRASVGGLDTFKKQQIYKWGHGKSRLPSCWGPGCCLLRGIIISEKDKSPNRRNGTCLLKSHFRFKSSWGELSRFFPCSLVLLRNLGEQVQILSDGIYENRETQKRRTNTKVKQGLCIN